jgi:hypothetical protein
MFWVSWRQPWGIITVPFTTALSPWVFLWPPPRLWESHSLCHKKRPYRIAAERGARARKTPEIPSVPSLLTATYSPVYALSPFLSPPIPLTSSSLSPGPPASQDLRAELWAPLWVQLLGTRLLPLCHVHTPLKGEMWFLSGDSNYIYYSVS